MKTVTNSNRYQITMHYQDYNAKLEFKNHNSDKVENVDVYWEDLEVDSDFLYNEVQETKQELQSVLFYLCYIKHRYDSNNNAKELELALDYLCEISLFGVETYNGWDWEDLNRDFDPETSQSPNVLFNGKDTGVSRSPANEILHMCIAKLLVTINHKL